MSSTIEIQYCNLLYVNLFSPPAVPTTVYIQINVDSVDSFSEATMVSLGLQLTPGSWQKEAGRC